MQPLTYSCNYNNEVADLGQFLVSGNWQYITSGGMIMLLNMMGKLSHFLLMKLAIIKDWCNIMAPCHFLSKLKC